MTEGGDLRAQLEAALKQNKVLKDENRKYVLRDVAGEFPLVEEADLTTVDGDLKAVKETAARIQSERTEQQKALLKSAGLDDEAVEKVLAGETLVAGAGNGEGEDDGGLGNVSAFQTTSGKLPPKVDESQLHGKSAIKAHFASKKGSADS